MSQVAVDTPHYSPSTRHAPRATRIVRQLEETRIGIRRFQLFDGAARLGLVLFAVAALVTIADCIWILDVGARLAGWIGMAEATVWILYRTLAPYQRFDRVETAVEIESRFPELGQRVRTTAEYAEPGANTALAAPGLVGALAADTDRRAQGLDFSHLIPWRLAWFKLAALAALSFIALVALAADRDLRIALGRMFMLPLHYTSLDVEPGDATLKVGESLSIKATLEGRPVRELELRSRPAGSGESWKVEPFVVGKAGEERKKLFGEIERTLADCRKDLEYQVATGSIESGVYRLSIIHPLVLKSVEGKVTPPQYTRQPERTETQGDFKVIEGSAIAWTFTLDRAPVSASLSLSRPKGEPAEAESLPNPPVANDGNRLTAQIPSLSHDIEYVLSAVAADTMELEPQRFRIRVLPDEKPTIQFVRPPEQLEVLATAEVAMQVEAADDFGVAKVGIVIQAGDGAEETLQIEEFVDRPITADSLTTLFLEKHGVDFTDAVTYYAFVEDNYPPGPHRVTTELRFIDIRPFKRAYQLKDEGGT